MKSNNEFTAICECGKLRHSNRLIANYWSQKKCDSCNKKMCVFQNFKLIYDYNKTNFTAFCDCGYFFIQSKTIQTYWSQMKCQSCCSRLVVKDQNNNVLFNYKSKKPKTIKKCQIIMTEQEKTPIRNDIFMGYNALVQISVQNLKNEEIEEELEMISNNFQFDFHLETFSNEFLS